MTRAVAGGVATASRSRSGGGVWSAVALGLSGGFLALVLALGAAAVVIPALAGAKPLAVLTASMTPRLPPGTLLIVRPEPLDRISIGDVLTYHLKPGRPEVLSHRVVQVAAHGDGTLTFITKGDANAQPDPPVVPRQVVGVVWYSIPFVGYLTTALDGGVRGWLAPLVGVALLVYAAWNVASVVRRRARRSTAVGRPERN